jgi:hypothetical protein
MAKGNAKHGFKDSTGSTTSEKEDGRYLMVEKQIWKGKPYITIGWVIDGKDGKQVHLAGKQCWMSPDAFKDLYEDNAFADAYKACGGKK